MDIFISYRRDDSAVAARLLYKELVERFGATSVFMDIDDIGYGDDFAAVIDQRIARTDVVLIVIGARWHQIIEERLRGDDWVRHEVAQALARRAAGLAPDPTPPDRPGRPLVLPVQLDDAVWPGPPLPPDLAPLQRLSALKFQKAALKAQLNELIQAVQGHTFEEKSAELANDLRTGWRTRAAALAIGVLLFFAAWMAVFDLLALDTRLTSATIALAGTAPASQQPSQGVVLIGIDENTVKAVGRKFGPLWRLEHARLIERAADAGARVIAFDVVMPAAADAAADAALEQALARVQPRMPVILGVQGAADGGPEIAPRLLPLVGWGVACAGQRLGRARLMPLVVQRASVGPGRKEHDLWPSLALSAFSGGGRVEALDLLGQRVQVRVPAQQRSPWIDFFSSETVVAGQSCAALAAGDRVASQWIDPLALGARGDRVPRVAYEQVLGGDPQALQALAGRIAIVGVLLHQEDSFRLPALASVEPWGSELIAAQVDALLEGRIIRSLGPVAQWLLMTALALAGSALWLALRRRSAWQRALALGAAALAVLASVLGWYRVEQQLVAPHYSLGALLFGAWVASWLVRRGSSRR